MRRLNHCGFLKAGKPSRGFQTRGIFSDQLAKPQIQIGKTIADRDRDSGISHESIVAAKDTRG